MVVADGVVEMTPKQRGDLLKLVQEMGDIDINSRYEYFSDRRLGRLKRSELGWG